MKLLVLENFRGGKLITSFQARQAFYLDPQPLPGLHVYIAACGVSPWAEQIRRITLALGPPTNGADNAQTVALGAGKLFMFMMQSPLEIELGLDPTGFSRIWPNNGSLMVPPIRDISVREADDVANIFSSIFEAHHAQEKYKIGS